MPASRVSYRIYYWTKTGRPTTLGRAYSFSIFYGKLKIFSKYKFTMRKKSERAAMLLATIENLEKLRKRTLAQAKRKETLRRKKDPLRYERIVNRYKDDNGFTIHEFETYSKEYSKKYVDKVVTSRNLKGDLSLRILDFTLTSPIEISEYDDIGATGLMIEEIFYPHMEKFYKAYNHKSTGMFLTRIKYDEEYVSREGEVYIQKDGLGLGRNKKRLTYDEFERDLLELFHSWFVDRMKRYTMMSFSGSLYITGFTMEVIRRVV